MSRAWICLVFLLNFCFPVLANESVDLVTSIRSEIWSGSRHLDNVRDIKQVGVWVRGRTSFGNTMLVGNGWVSERDQRAGGDRGRVREAYWRHLDGQWDLKVGRQMIAWGRADGLNPTDHLSPRDYTLLTPEENDLRHGNEVVDVKYSNTSGSFNGIYFPRSASHKIPLTAQPGVQYILIRDRRPQWAMKWETNGDLDGSVSYFNGADLMPDLSLGTIDPVLGSLGVVLKNNPMQVLGGDFSFTHEGIVWRGEIAWMKSKSEGENDFSHKKPQVWAVGGAEWALLENTTFGIQGSIKRVFDFQSPDTIAHPIERAIAWRQAATSDQVLRTQLGMIYRLATRLQNETVILETSGAHFGNSRSGVWRTKLDYAYNDNLNLVVGTHRYYGSEQSFFGQLKKNSVLYVQARLAL